MDCSLPGCSVHGILQARILEWVAISFSRASSQCRDQTQVSQVSCIGRWILYQWWERKYHTENHSLHFQADSTSITAVKNYCIFSSLKHHKFIILELARIPTMISWAKIKVSTGCFLHPPISHSTWGLVYSDWLQNSVPWGCRTEVLLSHLPSEETILSSVRLSSSSSSSPPPPSQRHQCWSSAPHDASPWLPCFGGLLSLDPIHSSNLE